MTKRKIFATFFLALTFMWIIPEFIENAFLVRAEGTNRSVNEQGGRNQGEVACNQSMITAYANKIIKLTNAERKKAGLQALDVDNEAMAAANLRANEIEHKFSHTRPDGRPYKTVLSEFGVKSYNWWGENILYSGGNIEPAVTINHWMGSDGHRANILKHDYTHIGVGVHRNKGLTYVVQLFIRRKN